MSGQEIPKITDPKALTGVYKKRGAFDKQRKTLLENFKSSETHSNLLLKLKLMVESKVKNNPDILMKNKGKMAALIQGEIMSEHNSKDSTSLLSIVDKDIQEKIIDSPEFHELLRKELKEVKRREEGITDEEFNRILEEEHQQEQQKKAQLQKDKEIHNSDKERSSYRPNKVTKAPRFKYNSVNTSRNSSTNKEGNSSGNSSTSAGSTNEAPKKGFHLMY
ncbi:hypothetical protein PSN45_004343 [Yamadazyma tenuis]|uniref:BOD1/SHG1 domain-containing protein n=1 Tax=Candida tenuis (strain ATCC 10573 / BCRC 21748 / CBS 615 / JCM 9827 / NBRC 10315 / NRRL Y-1498 / VKM Y-70) TaxID=590646 RepID=G3B642_CANTC|nr:uncharacterized protein CANTEDRAFT_135198 [Yamadazyma tenuis ATCC 10573]EGV63377.1 hypothetical protein CANTEDRAFT_135198 [Yamadazyma tenuis ATCC 10573]WEJ96799.1 hypothetical protein PSN45_004343 [Yamadazyma tenuis]